MSETLGVVVPIRAAKAVTVMGGPPHSVAAQITLR
ncbi:hypothetical protein JOF49_002053 [Corynebacterium suicordis]|nr:hypothetical protein [Corynebacterium suicordis]